MGASTKNMRMAGKCRSQDIQPDLKRFFSGFRVRLAIAGRVEGLSGFGHFADAAEAAAGVEIYLVASEF